MIESELASKREAKYFQIIETLNKRRNQGSSDIYDCGALGFAWIDWDRYGWNVKWFEPINAQAFLRQRARRKG